MSLQFQQYDFSLESRLQLMSCRLNTPDTLLKTHFKPLILLAIIKQLKILVEWDFSSDSTIRLL